MRILERFIYRLYEMQIEERVYRFEFSGQKQYVVSIYRKLAYIFFLPEKIL